MNQKEVTVSTILSVLKERDVEYVMGGDIPISEVLTDKDKSNIRSVLFTMFTDGDATFKDEVTTDKYLSDESELKKYVSGLLNNWIRKFKGFNCGQVYRAKNPGSRAHAQDDQLKALKALMTQYDAESTEYNDICKAIDTRKAEIEATKATAKPIDVSALPEHLRELVKS